MGEHYPGIYEPMKPIKLNLGSPEYYNHRAPAFRRDNPSEEGQLWLDTKVNFLNEVMKFLPRTVTNTLTKHNYEKKEGVRDHYKRNDVADSVYNSEVFKDTTYGLWKGNQSEALKKIFDDDFARFASIIGLPFDGNIALGRYEVNDEDDNARIISLKEETKEGDITGKYYLEYTTRRGENKKIDLSEEVDFIPIIASLKGEEYAKNFRQGVNFHATALDFQHTSASYDNKLRQFVVDANGDGYADGGKDTDGDGVNDTYDSLSNTALSTSLFQTDYLQELGIYMPVLDYGDIFADFMSGSKFKDDSLDKKLEDSDKFTYNHLHTALSDVDEEGDFADFLEKIEFNIQIGEGGATFDYIPNIYEIARSGLDMSDKTVWTDKDVFYMSMLMLEARRRYTYSMSTIFGVPNTNTDIKDILTKYANPNVWQVDPKEDYLYIDVQTNSGVERMYNYFIPKDVGKNIEDPLEKKIEKINWLNKKAVEYYSNQFFYEMYQNSLNNTIQDNLIDLKGLKINNFLEEEKVQEFNKMIDDVDTLMSPPNNSKLNETQLAQFLSTFHDIQKWLTEVDTVNRQEIKNGGSYDDNDVFTEGSSGVKKYYFDEESNSLFAKEWKKINEYFTKINYTSSLMTLGSLDQVGTDGKSQYDYYVDQKMPNLEIYKIDESDPEAIILDTDAKSNITNRVFENMKYTFSKYSNDILAKGNGFAFAELEKTIGSFYNLADNSGTLFSVISSMTNNQARIFNDLSAIDRFHQINYGNVREIIIDETNVDLYALGIGELGYYPEKIARSSTKSPYLSERYMPVTENYFDDSSFEKNEVNMVDRIYFTMIGEMQKMSSFYMMMMFSSPIDVSGDGDIGDNDKIADSQLSLWEKYFFDNAVYSADLDGNLYIPYQEEEDAKNIFNIDFEAKDGYFSGATGATDLDYNLVSFVTDFGKQVQLDNTDMSDLIYSAGVPLTANDKTVYLTKSPLGANYYELQCSYKDSNNVWHAFVHTVLKDDTNFKVVASSIDNGDTIISEDFFKNISGVDETQSKNIRDKLEQENILDVNYRINIDVDVSDRDKYDDIESEQDRDYFDGSTTTGEAVVTSIITKLLAKQVSYVSLEQISASEIKDGVRGTIVSGDLENVQDRYGNRIPITIVGNALFQHLKEINIIDDTGKILVEPSDSPPESLSKDYFHYGYITKTEYDNLNLTKEEQEQLEEYIDEDLIDNNYYFLNDSVFPGSIDTTVRNQLNQYRNASKIDCWGGDKGIKKILEDKNNHEKNALLGFLINNDVLSKPQSERKDIPQASEWLTVNNFNIEVSYEDLDSTTFAPEFEEYKENIIPKLKEIKMPSTDKPRDFSDISNDIEFPKIIDNKLNILSKLEKEVEFTGLDDEQKKDLQRFVWGYLEQNEISSLGITFEDITSFVLEEAEESDQAYQYVFKYNAKTLIANSDLTIEQKTGLLEILEPRAKQNYECSATSTNFTLKIKDTAMTDQPSGDCEKCQLETIITDNEDITELTKLYYASKLFDTIKDKVRDLRDFLDINRHKYTYDWNTTLKVINGEEISATGELDELKSYFSLTEVEISDVFTPPSPDAEEEVIVDELKYDANSKIDELKTALSTQFSSLNGKTSDLTSQQAIVKIEDTTATPPTPATIVYNEYSIINNGAIGNYEHTNKTIEDAVSVPIPNPLPDFNTDSNITDNSYVQKIFKLAGVDDFDATQTWSITVKKHAPNKDGNEQYIYNIEGRNTSGEEIKKTLLVEKYSTLADPTTYKYRVVAIADGHSDVGYQYNFLSPLKVSKNVLAEDKNAYLQNSSLFASSQDLFQVGRVTFQSIGNVFLNNALDDDDTVPSLVNDVVDHLIDVGILEENGDQYFVAIIDNDLIQSPFDNLNYTEFFKQISEGESYNKNLLKKTIALSIICKKLLENSYTKGDLIRLNFLDDLGFLVDEDGNRITDDSNDQNVRAKIDVLDFSEFSDLFKKDTGATGAYHNELKKVLLDLVQGRDYILSDGADMTERRKQVTDEYINEGIKVDYNNIKTFLSSLYERMSEIDFVDSGTQNNSNALTEAADMFKNLDFTANPSEIFKKPIISTQGYIELSPIELTPTQMNNIGSLIYFDYCEVSGKLTYNQTGTITQISQEILQLKGIFANNQSTLDNFLFSIKLINFLRDHSNFAYDDISGKLSIIGSMTTAQKNELNNIFLPATYPNKVQNLYDNSQYSFIPENWMNDYGAKTYEEDTRDLAEIELYSAIFPTASPNPNFTSDQKDILKRILINEGILSEYEYDTTNPTTTTKYCYTLNHGIDPKRQPVSFEIIARDGAYNDTGEHIEFSQADLDKFINIINKKVLGNDLQTWLNTVININFESDTLNNNSLKVNVKDNLTSIFLSDKFIRIVDDIKSLHEQGGFENFSGEDATSHRENISSEDLRDLWSFVTANVPYNIFGQDQRELEAIFDHGNSSNNYQNIDMLDKVGRIFQYKWNVQNKLDWFPEDGNINNLDDSIYLDAIENNSIFKDSIIGDYQRLAEGIEEAFNIKSTNSEKTIFNVGSLHDEVKTKLKDFVKNKDEYIYEEINERLIVMGEVSDEIIDYLSSYTIDEDVEIAEEGPPLSSNYYYDADNKKLTIYKGFTVTGISGVTLPPGLTDLEEIANSLLTETDVLNLIEKSKRKEVELEIEFNRELKDSIDNIKDLYEFTYQEEHKATYEYSFINATKEIDYQDYIDNKDAIDGSGLIVHNPNPDPLPEDIEGEDPYIPVKVKIQLFQDQIENSDNYPVSVKNFITDNTIQFTRTYSDSSVDKSYYDLLGEFIFLTGKVNDWDNPSVNIVEGEDRENDTFTLTGIIYSDDKERLLETYSRRYVGKERTDVPKAKNYEYNPVTGFVTILSDLTESEKTALEVLQIDINNIIPKDFIDDLVTDSRRKFFESVDEKEDIDLEAGFNLTHSIEKSSILDYSGDFGAIEDLFIDEDMTPELLHFKDSITIEDIETLPDTVNENLKQILIEAYNVVQANTVFIPEYIFDPTATELERVTKVDGTLFERHITTYLFSSGVTRKIKENITCELDEEAVIQDSIIDSLEDEYRLFWSHKKEGIQDVKVFGAIEKSDLLNENFRKLKKSYLDDKFESSLPANINDFFEEEDISDENTITFKANAEKLIHESELDDDYKEELLDILFFGDFLEKDDDYGYYIFKDAEHIDVETIEDSEKFVDDNARRSFWEKFNQAKNIDNYQYLPDTNNSLKEEFQRDFLIGLNKYVPENVFSQIDGIDESDSGTIRNALKDAGVLDENYQIVDNYQEIDLETYFSTHHPEYSDNLDEIEAILRNIDTVSSAFPHFDYLGVDDESATDIFQSFFDDNLLEGNMSVYNALELFQNRNQNNAGYINMQLEKYNNISSQIIEMLKIGDDTNSLENLFNREFFMQDEFNQLILGAEMQSRFTEKAFLKNNWDILSSADVYSMTEQVGWYETAGRIALEEASSSITKKMDLEKFKYSFTTDLNTQYQTVKSKMDKMTYASSLDATKDKSNNVRSRLTRAVRNDFDRVFILGDYLMSHDASKDSSFKNTDFKFKINSKVGDAIKIDDIGALQKLRDFAIISYENGDKKQYDAEITIKNEKMQQLSFDDFQSIVYGASPSGSQEERSREEVKRREFYNFLKNLGWNNVSVGTNFSLPHSMIELNSMFMEVIMARIFISFYNDNMEKDYNTRQEEYEEKIAKKQEEEVAAQMADAKARQRQAYLKSLRNRRG
jgi:hypothetical protein